ncbi:MAG: hypothetical protein JO061_02945 [Acidobacteriaceae bacterium]|nr:hypothetical protein [Acidobacteriaceae bacterium]
MKKTTKPNRSETHDQETQRTFARVVDAFAADKDVTYGGGKGFGSTALKVRGKIFAMVSSRGQFVAKLPRERVEELVTQGTGHYFDSGRGKLMKEWVALDAAYPLWPTLAMEARRFVGGAK